MRNIVVNQKLNIPIKPVTITEIVFWLFFMISVMFKCFYFQFTTQLNSWPLLSSTNINMLASYIGILTMISAIVMLLKKRRVFALLIINIVLTTILIADTNFFRYYNTAITIPVLFQFNLSLVESIDQSIMSLFKVKDIIYALDLPLMVVGLVLFTRNKVSEFSFKRRFIASTLTLIIGFTFFLSSYVKADNKTFSYDNNFVIKSLGVFYFHYYNTNEFVNDSILKKEVLTNKDKVKIRSFFSSKTRSGDNFKGIAKGKNLIVLQLEAIQQFVINRSIGGKEITPNLNRFIKESLYFDNLYYQTAGGNTSDAEFLCNASLYPAKEGAVYHRYPANRYYTIPTTLKSQGYETYAFHAYKPEFYNRQEMYKAIGFDHFFSYHDFQMDDLVGWDGKSLSDASFYRQSLEKLDTSKPFYSFLIALSSHHPFTFFEDFDFDAGDFEKTYLGNYIKAANYADECFGLFLDDLKRRDLYDDTLLVVYGDHSAVPRHQAGELMDFLDIPYSEFNWFINQKVPLIIHYPGVENGKTNSTTAGQIDIFPTIANLMDIDASFTMGKDMLNTQKGYAVLRNGSLITDDLLYCNSSGNVYDVKTGKLIDKQPNDKDIKALQNELFISDFILKNDAFSK